MLWVPEEPPGVLRGDSLARGFENGFLGVWLYVTGHSVTFSCRSAPIKTRGAPLEFRSLDDLGV